MSQEVIPDSLVLVEVQGDFEVTPHVSSSYAAGHSGGVSLAHFTAPKWHLTSQSVVGMVESKDDAPIV